jgi:serine/threonine-protein kinase
MQLENGESFAGYAIVQWLGSGPVGDVYLAEDPRWPDHGPGKVALKIPSEAASANPTFCTRYLREAVPATKLWHPNLVRVHDRGQFNGRPWITMDYVEGADGAHLIARRFRGGMPEHDVHAIVTAVAYALDYIHQCQCWHRGVKPTNILLGQSAIGERRILLSDFMTGCQLVGTTGLTATSTDIGPLVYAAPEQLGNEPNDDKVDQYALAATAFHLLTGAPPYQGRDLTTLVTQLICEPPPRLSDRRPDLAHLDQVLATALSKSPVDRFGGCREFAIELARASGQAGSL